jgi:hypothetical protein
MCRAVTYIDVVFPKSAEVMLAPLSPKDRRFLTREFKEIVVMREDEEFFTVEQTDSLEKAEEAYADYFVTFAAGIDPDPVCAAGIDCQRISAGYRRPAPEDRGRYRQAAV